MESIDHVDDWQASDLCIKYDENGHKVLSYVTTKCLYIVFVI